MSEINSLPIQTKTIADLTAATPTAQDTLLLDQNGTVKKATIANVLALGGGGGGGGGVQDIAMTGYIYFAGPAGVQSFSHADALIGSALIDSMNDIQYVAPITFNDDTSASTGPTHVTLTGTRILSAFYGGPAIATMSMGGSGNSYTFPDLETIYADSFASFQDTGIVGVFFASLKKIVRANGKQSLDIDLSEQALTEASVDNILESLANMDGTNGTTMWDGYVNLYGGTSAPPSAAGLVSAGIIISRGGMVITN